MLFREPNNAGAMAEGSAPLLLGSRHSSLDSQTSVPELINE